MASHRRRADLNDGRGVDGDGVDHDVGAGGANSGTYNFFGGLGSSGAGGSHAALINDDQVYQHNDRGIILDTGGGNASLAATVTDAASADASASVQNPTVTTVTVTDPDDVAAIPLAASSLPELASASLVAGTGGVEAASSQPAQVVEIIVRSDGPDKHPGDPDTILLPGPPPTFTPDGGIERADCVDRPSLPGGKQPDDVDTIPAPAPPLTFERPTDGIILGWDCADGPGLPGGKHPTPQSASVVVDDGVLSQSELDYVVNAAIERWASAGVSGDQVAALQSLQFSLDDLGGQNLGVHWSGGITLDADAAGRGWYLDSTPFDDSEFGNVMAATWLQTDPTGAPAGHYDLLSAVMHEMGHALGLEDSYLAQDRGDLMYGSLFAGERRLPALGQADGAVAGSITNEALVASEVPVTPGVGDIMWHDTGSGYNDNWMLAYT